MTKAKRQNVSKNNKQKKTKTKAPAKKQRSTRTFGPVTTINTAPVAVGNSMRGVEAKVVHSSKDQVRIVGRDYAYTAYSSGTATGWMPVGGFPLTPVCFASSILRAYTQMFNKFKFNQVCCHYITSSPTSSNGDVLFQINANRTDPLPNWTSSTFLPYALSKPETVLGPQWQNHSCCFVPKNPIRTLVPDNVDIDYQSQGEVFLYSKTSTTESPGYVLIDYDITFYEMSINPHGGILPNPLYLYQEVQFYLPTTALTVGVTTIKASTGSTGAGGTAITSLWSNTNSHYGDVYKIAIDVANSNAAAWTASSGSPTFANLFANLAAGASNGLPISDGFTCYMVLEGATSATFYSTAAQAFTATNPIVAGATYTPNAYTDNSHNPNAGVWFYGMASLVGSISGIAQQQQ